MKKTVYRKEMSDTKTKITVELTESYSPGVALATSQALFLEQLLITPGILYCDYQPAERIVITWDGSNTWTAELEAIVAKSAR